MLLGCAVVTAAAASLQPLTPFSEARDLLQQNPGNAIAPKTITVDGKRLLIAKAALAVGEPSTTKALASLLKDADGWLNYGPWTVMSKNITAPTGDKHDFMVQNAYFWPSENSTDGCPYVPRDGIANPDVSVSDDQGLRRTLESSWILALAWYYTENEAYAEHASMILKTWFLEEETKMNPNMDFGSWLPCMEPEDNPYNFASLIGFSSRISFVIDAIRILEATNAPGWSKNDTARMTAWCTEMIDWLMHSPVGSQILVGFNNHGVYAHLAGINMGMYVGDNHLARQLLHNVTARIDDGITANGSQPHELIRTQAFHYSMFTLVGFSRIIAMGEKLCIDLWKYIGPEGQSVQKGIEFLIPAALNGKDVWPYPENIHFRRAAPNDILHFAAERGSQMALDALTSCQLEEPSLGDRWPIRPAPQELEATSILEPSD
ncbi:alginate lyase-domain-containing protein [Plectosphaerella plurivora]|uniref:Alginate lyase-domain-containing protein n=1 Tax=Plectosphaerella plurivora TaxID=936078 RepID=A0A9P8VF13_9PEZI|nr:alginate lyase-domain-containing protein [Plectosphaerella plurivora]